MKFSENHEILGIFSENHEILGIFSENHEITDTATPKPTPLTHPPAD